MQGKNLPVIPSQVEQGLGSDLLNQIAAKTGLSPARPARDLPAYFRIWSQAYP